MVLKEIYIKKAGIGIYLLDVFGGKLDYALVFARSRISKRDWMDKTILQKFNIFINLLRS